MTVTGVSLMYLALIEMGLEEKHVFPSHALNSMFLRVEQTIA